MKVVELQDLLRELNLKTSGRKEELVGRVLSTTPAKRKKALARHDATAAAQAAQEQEFRKLKVIELQALLRELELPASGKKDELVCRLLSASGAKRKKASAGKKPIVHAKEVRQRRSKKDDIGLRRVSTKDPSIDLKTNEGLQEESPLEQEDEKESAGSLADIQDEDDEVEGSDVGELMQWKRKRVHEASALEDGSESSRELVAEADQRIREYLEYFPEMKDQLRPHQLEGVRQSLLRRGRYLIADEMGLGKTLQALVVAQIYSEEWPVLIVAPNSVVLNWRTEVEKWLPHLTNEVQVLDKAVLKEKDKRAVHHWHTKQIFLTSYDQISLHPRLGRRPDDSPYKVVILDEAHSIKNPLTMRAQALLPVCRDALRCTLLTGTPVLNCAAELWPLLAALDPAIPDYDKFCERYSDFKELVKDGQPQEVPFGVRHPEELHELMASFMVRRKKTEVLSGLAEKRRHVKVFSGDELDGKPAKAIFVKRHVLRKYSQGQSDAPYIFSQTAKAKAAAVTDFVGQTIVEQAGSKIVVFGHHSVLLDKLEKKLKKLGVGYIRIDGKVQRNVRQARVSSFQTNDEVQVALVGILACGQGISLTAARIAIFAELYWVPARLLQAEDRVHRPGQENSVDVYYCVAKGQPWMDEGMIRSLMGKELLADKIVDGEAMPSRFSGFVS